MFRAAMKHQGERPNLCNNVTEVEAEAITGNSRAYSIARVQRECDAETVAAVMAGRMENDVYRISIRGHRRPVGNRPNHG